VLAAVLSGPSLRHYFDPAEPSSTDPEILCREICLRVLMRRSFSRNDLAHLCALFFNGGRELRWGPDAHGDSQRSQSRTNLRAFADSGDVTGDTVAKGNGQISTTSVST